MSTSAKSGYHHGDLRATLIDSAMSLLERGEAFSLRGLAREIGVSPTASYRHFPDKDALESALATVGFRNLRSALDKIGPLPTDAAGVAEFGVVYVEFALSHPELFRLMFRNNCDHGSAERVEAVAAVNELLFAAVTDAFPNAEPGGIALAGWGLVHGLACLHLDGKLEYASTDEVAQRVRDSFAAVLNAG